MESSFRFSPSPFLFALFSAAGAVAVAGTLWIISIPPPLRVLAAVVLTALFARAAYRHALLRGKRAVRAVSFLPKGEVEIFAADGIRRGRLLSARITPPLAVFVAECGGKKFNVLAAFDGMAKDHHRQLRVWLKMHSPPPQPSLSDIVARRAPDKSEKKAIPPTNCDIIKNKMNPERRKNDATRNN